MSNNHILTKEIGNLRGFSTDNIFVRPPNVADISLNIQRAPDTSQQFRRGYQCQISKIGGLGLGTFDDPANDVVHTVTIGLDGQLYNKLIKQIYFYYDGQVTGTIIGITQAVNAVVHSVGHGLITGTIVTFENVGGMFQINGLISSITFIDADHYSLDDIDSTAFNPYTTGGDWIIFFTQYRYLLFTIFTDPRYLTTNPGWSIAPWSISPWGAPSGESITANITVFRAAIIDGNQTSVTTINVQFGSELSIGDTVQFYDVNGMLQQKVLTGATTTSITFVGVVSVSDGVYVNQFFDIPFRKGFDVVSPYLISTFITTITDPITGVFGLKVAYNGDIDYPAAFLQIFEPVIIDSNRTFIIDYWYWQLVNHTIPVPFPGLANPKNQNSVEFENASLACYDDVVYIADGYDYPQKYDGQTVYRVGMPIGSRPTLTANTTGIQPFSNQVYSYASSFEQIDNRGHLVEGTISDRRAYTVTTNPSATNVFIKNIPAGSVTDTNGSTDWNTNGAIAAGGTAVVYGPDSDGFFYDTVLVNPNYTLKIGDTAFYRDLKAAVVTVVADTNVLPVAANFNVNVGDIVIFDNGTKVFRRSVLEVDHVANTITVDGPAVPALGPSNILSPQASPVFGDLAITDLDQFDVNTINIVAYPLGFQQIVIGDTVSFIDAFGLLQRRVVTATPAGQIVVSGIPISILDRTLIYSENTTANSINIQKQYSGAVELGTNAPISNNLRILIYRTKDAGANLFFVDEIPNDSIGSATQTYVDRIADDELGFEFEQKIYLPDPPPISKYLKVFGSQLLYAGGEVNNPDNSDNVFFSDGDSPEYVSAAKNFFTVPSVDDDVTGLGVAGTTLVVFKGQSIWSVTGDLLTSQFEVVQVAAGSNIGCIANATIQSVGNLLYFLHTNGVYSMTENQIFPTDAFGNPVPISNPIDVIFRETNFLPQTRYVLKRAVAINYTKDNQYLLFLPCEDIQATIRTANSYSIILCYDYQGKNWFKWDNMNAAGGMVVILDNLYFQERRFSGIDGNTANLYKQHRFYRLIDHADHAGSQRIEWRSSWTDLGLPEVRKKFSHCVLLMDRINDLYQYNDPKMYFSSYVDRIPNLQSTIAQVTTVDNIRNSSWSFSGWGWNFWAGYQDSFVRINLKGGTVAKSIQIGFTITGINMDMKFSGYQLEAIPENRRTFAR